MSVGKRTFGWMYAFMYVHETRNRVKSKFLPKRSEFLLGAFPLAGETTL